MITNGSESPTPNPDGSYVRLKSLIRRGTSPNTPWKVCQRTPNEGILPNKYGLEQIMVSLEVVPHPGFRGWVANGLRRRAVRYSRRRLPEVCL